MTYREQVRAAVTKAMDAQKIDAWVYPTWSNVPRLIGDLNTPGGDNSQFFSPTTGFPSIQVPMGYTRGGRLPAGITFFGRAWSEPALIKYAYAYEQATRHRRRREHSAVALTRAFHHGSAKVTRGFTKVLMAINGLHGLLYTSEPEKLRAMLRDVFGFKHVDAGGGWLIFAMPPAELGVHPDEGENYESGIRHQLTFMCDNIGKTIAELRAKGVTVAGEPKDEGYGITTMLQLPGGCEVMLYEPRHADCGGDERSAKRRAAKTSAKKKCEDSDEEAAVRKASSPRRVGELRQLVDVGKFQRLGVHAVPLPRRRRAIGKHVTEMAVAARAENLDAHHAVGAIGVSWRRSRRRSAGRSSASRCPNRISHSTQTAAARNRCTNRRRHACCRAACRRTAARCHARERRRTARA